MYRVVVLQAGYSVVQADGSMRANGTSTLVVGGEHRVVVDTLSPWDRGALVAALAREGVRPEEVTHLVRGMLLLLTTTRCAPTATPTTWATTTSSPLPSFT